MQTLENATHNVELLESQLAAARDELADLTKRRVEYEKTVEPVIAATQKTVGDSIAQLTEWRRRFRDAVQNFATDGVGALGRELVEIQRELYPTLNGLVGTVYHAKRRELRLSTGPEHSLERTQYCERAARDALVAAGGTDPRLAVWRGVDSETGKRFREMIEGFLADQRVRLYHPGARGLTAFGR